jgi:ATP/maltotriose-dependent transcriptional regulator MalT
MRGRFDEARDEIARGVALYEELGQTAAAVVFGGAVGGDVELLAGDFEAAERILTEVCALLEGAQNRHELSTRAADLAEAFYRQARYLEAERWAATAEDNAAGDNLSAQPLWRAVKAKTLARRGDLSAAISLCNEALTFVDLTEASNRRARVLIDLAEILQLGGRQAEARSAVDRAAGLYRGKGNVAGMRIALAMGVMRPPP